MCYLYLVPFAALAVVACQQQGEGKQDSKATAVAEATPAKTTADKPLPAAKAGACMMQDGKELAVKPIRALGTEPLWGAEVEGRCVTYTTPENQKGTRIWTRYTATADGGRWSGTLDGSKFELVTRKQADCSDGMSDNKFPMAADLMVNGEQRKGCAK
jgi:uncharacterized membrane protein